MMHHLTSPEFWARWLGILFVDLSLAGDNALVIAMAIVSLPPRQRFIGLCGGTIGAVILRIALIAVVTQLLSLPLLKAAGGLVLIWIAIKLVRQEVGDAKENTREVRTFWNAIGIIIVADLIMSLDNVMAVAATAHGDLVLVMFGIGLSIPMVICGSSLLARLMDQFPWIVWLGGGVLGWVAGELIVDDIIVQRWTAPFAVLLSWALPALLSISITVIAWWLGRTNKPASES
jgi:YjbE family integral membrane protein